MTDRPAGGGGRKRGFTIPRVDGEILRLALGSLRAHKMRGGLTILGIVIGITSVVGMVSLVEGLNRSMQGQLNALGSDVIRIRKFDPGVFVGDIPDSLRKRKNFDEADAQGLRECPSVLAVTTYTFARERLHYQGKETRLADITGIDGSYLTVNSVGVAEGRPITETEARSGARVALLGPDYKKEIFAGVDPVGAGVQIGSQRFEVVGILTSRGKFVGQSLDSDVLIPKPALERYFGIVRQPLYISAKPLRPALLDRAIEEMTESLRRTRRLRPQDANDFSIVTQGSLQNLWKQISGAFFVVVVAIASVALLVGGIGVMNIMLVSVTERTREIGIRKALGATRRQVLNQFLTEAMVLTGSGGILGILLGVGIGKLVDVLTPLPSFVPLWAYVIAFGVSVGVGLFFGIWPAVRAARLDPVEALRYE
jgi:putative ABC transport system permease protein